VKKTLLYVGGISILAYAIYRYIKVQTGLLQDFTYKIIGFQIQKFNKDQLSFTVKIRFTNKSSIEATVNKLYTDVFLDGKNIGYITEVRQFIIPAKGSSDIDLYFQIQPKDILVNAVDLLLGLAKNKDFILSLRGTAKVSSGFITTTIPVVYDTSLKQYL